MRKHAHLYRTIRIGPRGGKRPRYVAFDDNGDDIASTEQLGTMERALQRAGVTHVTRYKGTARPSEVAAHVGCLKAEAREAAQASGG